MLKQSFYFLGLFYLPHSLKRISIQLKMILQWTAVIKKNYSCLWIYFEKRTDNAQQKVSFGSPNIFSTNPKWKIISFINVLLIVALWLFNLYQSFKILDKHWKIHFAGSKYSNNRTTKTDHKILKLQLKKKRKKLDCD